MEVTVKLYSGFKKQDGTSRQVTLQHGAVALDLLRELDLAEHEVEILAVNGDLAQFDTPLQPGDKVSLIPFIGGG